MSPERGSIFALNRSYSTIFRSGTPREKGVERCEGERTSGTCQRHRRLLAVSPGSQRSPQTSGVRFIARGETDPGAWRDADREGAAGGGEFQPLHLPLEWHPSHSSTVALWRTTVCFPHLDVNKRTRTARADDPDAGRSGENYSRAPGSVDQGPQDI